MSRLSSYKFCEYFHLWVQCGGISRELRTLEHGSIQSFSSRQGKQKKDSKKERKTNVESYIVGKTAERERERERER